MNGTQDAYSCPHFSSRLLGPGFVARIEGLDLSRPLTPELFEHLNQALLRHKVLSFPTGPFNGGAGAFCPGLRRAPGSWRTTTTPGPRSSPSRTWTPKAGRKASTRTPGPASGTPTAPGRRGRCWPPAPRPRGAAQWRRHALRRPSGEADKARYRGLTAIHDLNLFAPAVRRPRPDDGRAGRRHRRSGSRWCGGIRKAARKGLYLGEHAHGIEGLDTEAEALIAAINAHITSAPFTHAYRWRKGDFVLHNRSVLHKATLYDARPLRPRLARDDAGRARNDLGVPQFPEGWLRQAGRPNRTRSAARVG